MSPRRSPLPTSPLAAALAPLLALALVLAPAGPAAAGTGSGSAAGADDRPASPAAEVTLVTGDRVNLSYDPGGALLATVDPAPRPGPDPVFRTVERDGDLYLFPSDAAPLVPQVLDRELFNLHKLAALADRGVTGGTPVIVVPGDGVMSLARMPGATVTASLPSIGAVAGVLGSAAGLPGLGRVWLDDLAEVTLDVSAPLVGAPEAWAAGYDGTGMRIAVLDTGIDADHPDLSGKVVAAENFTDEPDAVDRNGHGTHVAGTAAGAGEVYRGVAPGADLLNGKVCDATGNCQNSWVLAGMEWAAANADVVNMSLGSLAGSDGTDPLSQALNALSAQHDTLFVTSAGNSGTRGDGSVGSPGAADAALTVGSVDKQEQLAGSSSRGPRLGDFAIKPEITAPGVGIVAPRAAGTSLGAPVDDFYTALSGTSMASPHVAGAAAALAQHDPDLSAPELKALLAGTGVPHPELEVYQQGGGRLDIPAALAAPARADRAALDLGYFPWPHDGAEPAVAELSYTNRTDQPLTLELALALANRDGATPPAGMVAVSPATLTVPPGGTATTTVTLDVSIGEVGLYGGYLTASSGGERLVGIPVGFHKEPQMHTLTVEGLTREGLPALIGSSLYIGELTGTGWLQRDPLFFVDKVTLRVPSGSYHLMAEIPTYNKEHPGPPELVLVSEPELEITEDTTVVLDARSAVPVEIETPAHPDAVPDGPSRVGFSRVPAAGPGRVVVRFIINGWLPMYATPTDPVTIGEFGFHTRTRIRDTADPTYLYDLVFAERDRIPESLSYVADPAELAAVENLFHSGVTGQQMGDHRHMFRPIDSASVLGTPEVITGPLHRTDYLVGDDTAYRQVTYGQWPLDGSLLEPAVRYQPGEHREQSWFQTPVVPGVFGGDVFQDPLPTVRNGDELTVRTVEWVDPDGNFGNPDRDFDTAALRVYEDGALIGQAARGFGRFPVSPRPATHRLELDVSRDASWWPTSTRTRTAWTLRSPGTGSGPVPLLTASYQVDGVDLTNTAPGDLLQRVGLQVGYQPGADGPGILPRADAWVSYDDGASWRRQPVLPHGDGAFTLLVTPPRGQDPGSGFVSLRIAATDRAGNAIEQEVIRAYRRAG